VAYDISVAALWVAIGSSAVATVCYWAYLVGARLVVRRMATGAGEGPVVAMFESSGPGRAEGLARSATYALWVTLSALVVWLLARWQAVDHAPWSNMYEFTIAFAAGITAFYVIFERVYGQRVASTRMLGAVSAPTVLAMLVASAAFFPDDVRPLVPALQNTDLLAIHVAAMILAYAALSVSFGSAVLYLVQGEGRDRFERLPKTEVLDEIGYRSVMLGFPLLAAGIALGAYWANSAWGRYWGWDPKETSALVTLFIYGGYLHMRGLRNWAGARSAWVLILGFAAVMFTYFVVNLWVSGLHSYAGV
jgi:cytochrome c-type biogenesis protein CcsB